MWGTRDFNLTSFLKLFIARNQSCNEFTNQLKQLCAFFISELTPFFQLALQDGLESNDACLFHASGTRHTKHHSP